VAMLNVDKWTVACVDRLSAITSPEMMTMAELWILADTLWEANAHRDPIVVADEWEHGAAHTPRIWQGQGSHPNSVRTIRKSPTMPRNEADATQELVEASKSYHALIIEAIEGRIVPRSDIRDAFEKLAVAHDAWSEVSQRSGA